MLTEIRWRKEQELIESVFPEFKPFARGSLFGFEGCLKGPRSGQVYHVALEAEQANYPQCPPSVRVKPQIGPHWIGERARRRLCMEREWRPARSTFANTLLALIRYLDEHDSEPGGCPHCREEEETHGAACDATGRGRHRNLFGPIVGRGPY